MLSDETAITPSPIPDLDIYRSASVLVKQHGKSKAFAAKKRKRVKA